MKSNRELRVAIVVIVALVSAFASRAEQNCYELHIGEFNNLQVLDNINVVWCANKDSVGYVRFCGEDRFADAFLLNNNGKGTLKIQVATEDVNHPDLPTLYLYSSFLTEVKSSSELSVSVSGIPAAAKLKFNLIGNGSLTAVGLEAVRVEAKINTGNGTITLQGHCQDARFSMCGTGQIRADELNAENVNCNIMGTGSIFTWPMEMLSVKGIGSTKIYYRGTPVEIKKHGGGKLMPMTDNKPILNNSEPYISTPQPAESEEEMEMEEDEEEGTTVVPEREV